MVSRDNPPLFTDVASRNRNQRIAARDQDTLCFSDRGRAVNQATLECFQTDVQVKKVSRIRKVLCEPEVEPERGEAVAPSLQGAWRNIDPANGGARGQHIRSVIHPHMYNACAVLIPQMTCNGQQIRSTIGELTLPQP